MLVHILSTQRQFTRHMKPIFDALPKELRGDVIGHEPGRVRRLHRDDVFLVGGGGSIEEAKGRRVIYVEHGAGQTYVGLKARHSLHYSGGRHTPNVIGYVCPSKAVADRWHGRPAVVVGCPAIDKIKCSQHPDSVVITFHWDAPHVSPEARSARPHYVRHLGGLIERIKATGLNVLGHWHPRDEARAKIIWERLGVETEQDPDRALQRARLVIADNTSFAYEAAHMGIPGISLNAPWYRKTVHHGLRFWEAPPGIQVDNPDELIHRIDLVAQSDQAIDVARHASESAYGVPHGGNGAKLGSEFVQELLK